MLNGVLKTGNLKRITYLSGHQRFRTGKTTEPAPSALTRRTENLATLSVVSLLPNG